MKIRLPFSDRALIDFYNFLEDAVGGIGQIIPGPIVHLPKPHYRIPIKDYGEYSKIFNKKYRKQKIYQLIDYLRRNGYLKTKNLEKYKAFVLTPKGIEKILKIRIKTSISKIKSNKWLMVIFDIPEEKRKQRDHFRRMLKLLGYQQLQKSIWISPFAVAPETKNLIKIFNLQRFVQLLILEKIKF